MATKPTNDLLTGGPGKSNFVLRYGMGNDVIRDFGYSFYKASLADNDPYDVVSSAKGTALVGLARNFQSAVVHLEVKGLTTVATDADITGYNSVFDIATPLKTAFSVDRNWTDPLGNSGYLTSDNLFVRVATSRYPNGEITGRLIGIDGDTGADTIDLTALNITGMGILRHFVSEVGGNAKITIIKGGERSSFTLKGTPLYNLHEEDFKFSTSTKKDVLVGTAKVDDLFGGGGNDKLSGLAGNDLLFGDYGTDVIVGGAGRDEMWGGAGGDRFDFDRVTDSGKTAATRDIIHDFDQRDIIDLKDIDANGTAAGNGKFTLGYGKFFSGQRGDLKFYLQSTNKGVDTIVMGDIDGDKKADFQIEIDGRFKFHAGDFYL